MDSLFCIFFNQTVNIDWAPEQICSWDPAHPGVVLTSSILYVISNIVHTTLHCTGPSAYLSIPAANPECLKAEAIL